MQVSSPMVEHPPSTDQPDRPRSTSSTILAHKAPSAWLNKTCQSNSWRRCFFVWALNLRCFWKMIMNMAMAVWEHVWWLYVVCGFNPLEKLDLSFFFISGGGGKNFKKLLKPPSWLWSRWWLNHLNKYASKWISYPNQIRMSLNAYQHLCHLSLP